MIKTLSQHYRERRSMFVLVSCSMVLIVFLCAIYRRYAFAIVWHCFHKNVAQVGTFKVEVPLLWWKGESDAYGTSVLIRASPATVSDVPEIVVSPTIPGEGRDTDQETLKATQGLVDADLKVSIVGKSSVLAILHPRPFTLYCAKSAFIIPPDTVLNCRAAKAEYSFTYNGPSRREQEAEAILLGIR
jgi:hypothetical protein